LEAAKQYPCNEFSEEGKKSAQAIHPWPGKNFRADSLNLFTKIINADLAFAIDKKTDPEKKRPLFATAAASLMPGKKALPLYRN
jgi:hypothetical protein